LRDYQFRLQLYNKDRQEVIIENLMKMYKEQGGEMIDESSATLSDIVLPTFQKYLDTRDIQNYLLRSDNIKPLMVVDDVN
jgi:hypothetical protein